MSAKTWRMPEPCSDCPFNSRGDGLKLRRSLHPGRWASILSDLRDDGNHVLGRRERICAGAIAWQDKHECVADVVQIARRLEAFAAKRKAAHA